jgi:ArsR family transcriptional regulator
MSESIFKALSDPNRREILRLLRKRTMNAGEIAAHFSLAKSTLSSHFNILKKSGLIQEERNRTTIYYSLNLSVAEEALATVMDLLGTGRKHDFREKEAK